ncbi:hypothetical protein ACJJTC_014763 [Scirpophaga incertulas]
MLSRGRLFVCLVLIFYLSSTICENKYSRDANVKETKGVDFRTLEKPFRMNKLNLLWLKAQQRLTEPKLKSLYSDLMIQDKEEITFKRFKNDGGDKDGLKEAELRRKLTNIISSYGLRAHFGDDSAPKKNIQSSKIVSDDHINKSLFKDKKLNQLWEKAELSGFTSAELAALKEEFNHHQDKIDQYYDLLNNVDSGPQDQYKNIVDEEETVQYNEINADLETNEVNKNYLDKANLVREKHRGITDGFDRLQRLTAKGPNNKEFIEPKVQGLWRMATEAKFTPDELASLKVELQHYEKRLLKLRHLHADQVRNAELYQSKVAATGDKLDHFDHEQQTIKKHARKVEKMHADLEKRILERHSEL